MSWYEPFSRNYLEAFGVEEKVDTDSESNEGETMPKKPSLDKIKKILMHNRKAERFADYEGLMSGPNMTLTEKIFHCEKVIGDMTRWKIYYVSLQGQSLQSCFNR